MPFRVFCGGAAQQVADRAVAEVQAFGFGEVEHAGLADDAGQVHRAVVVPAQQLAVRVRGAKLREAAPSGGPDRKVAAGGVSQRHDPVQAEAMFAGDVAEFVDSGEHVREGVGPAAAVAGAAVLQVPGGHAVRREVFGQRFAEFRAVLRTPVSAVDDHHHALGGGGLRQEKLTPLARIIAVAVPMPLHSVLLGAR